MIHYALRCAGGHEFDGWFRSSASFDDQSARGLLACPVCAGTSVQRALMAPNVRTRAAIAPAATARADTGAAAAPANDPQVPNAAASAAPRDLAPVAPNRPPPGTAVSAPMPDQVRAVLQRIRAEVEKSCDYVGPHFAEAARGIASGQDEKRPIYGEATPEQEAELADEGIEVSRIPWVPRANG